MHAEDVLACERDAQQGRKSPEALHVLLVGCAIPVRPERTSTKRESQAVVTRCFGKVTESGAYIGEATYRYRRSISRVLPHLEKKIWGRSRARAVYV